MPPPRLPLPTSTLASTEQCLRRMAKRQGLRLHKSRSRSPLATIYGHYTLFDAAGGRVGFPGENGKSRKNVGTLVDIGNYLGNPA
jgi:hypothetical protein